LINSFANKPLLSNIRNDFVVWGTTSTDAPIHLRYAIDNKPQEYFCLFNGITYYTEDNWRFGEIGKKIYFEPGRNNGLNCHDVIVNEENFLSAMTETLGTTELNGYYSFHWVYVDNGDGTYSNKWQYFLADGRSRYSDYFGITIPEKPEYINQTVIVTVNLDALQWDTNNF